MAEITAGSKKVAAVALKMALTESRAEEISLKEKYLKENIHAAAVDYGGEILSSINKIIERAVVAAKREGIITSTHTDEGAVAGATHEALLEVMPKSLGLNVGGKIGIARFEEHISVAVFFSIGLLHLDDVAVGLGHRVSSLTSERS